MMVNEKQDIRAAVIGGSGYVGLELIRLLSQHPEVKITNICSRSNVGVVVSDVHQSLKGVVDLTFDDTDTDFSEVNVIFIAVPHTESMSLVSRLKKEYPDARLIDLGADFRLPKNVFENTYGVPHASPELLAGSVYGIPEFFGDVLDQASVVAVPGCFAHCLSIALAPLAAKGVIEKEIFVSAITGSTGSGAKVSPKTHHPERNESVSAYQILKHRHVPEVENALRLISAEEGYSVNLVTQSGPFTRGIFATIFLRLKDKDADIASMFRDYEKENVFIRLREESPKLKDVRGSNFCDISFAQNGDVLVVMSAIDNLVKGAAGTAVHCMNIQFAIDESAGLLGAPLSL